VDDLRAGTPGDLVAERGALVTVQLHERQARGLHRLIDLLEARVDEHAGELDGAPQGGPDELRLAELAAARRAGPEDHSERPRS
jgi:hypothetical protein